MPKDIGLIQDPEVSWYAATKREFPTRLDFLIAVTKDLVEFHAADEDLNPLYYRDRVEVGFLRYCVGECSYTTFDGPHREWETIRGKGHAPAWGLCLGL